MSLPDPVKLAKALNPPKSLREFSRRFRTETDCEEFLFRIRYPDGFVCPRCGVAHGWPLDGKRLIECANGHKVSLTAGTVLHGTRQDLLTWFHAVLFISTLTPGISALQFQRLLGLKRYETAFQMLHKVRSTLVAPGRESLHREVEVDETFIGGKDPDRAGVAVTRYWWWALSNSDPSANPRRASEANVLAGFGFVSLQMLQRTHWLGLSNKKLNRVPSSTLTAGTATDDCNVQVIFTSESFRARVARPYRSCHTYTVFFPISRHGCMELITGVLSRSTCRPIWMNTPSALIAVSGLVRRSCGHSLSW